MYPFAPKAEGYRTNSSLARNAELRWLAVILFNVVASVDSLYLQLSSCDKKLLELVPHMGYMESSCVTVTLFNHEKGAVWYRDRKETLGSRNSRFLLANATV